MLGAFFLIKNSLTKGRHSGKSDMFFHRVSTSDITFMKKKQQKNTPMGKLKIQIEEKMIFGF